MAKITEAVAIMPVGKQFDRVFTQAIFPAAAESGVTLNRVKPAFASESRLGSTCRQLEETELVLVDISARNPHSMYLAGYAHGIGRKVLFLAQHGEEFPFDQSRHDTIIYGSDLALLKQSLLDYFASGSVAREDAVERKEPLNARELFEKTFGDILAKHQHEHRGDIYMENPTTFVLVNQDMDLPLVEDLARRGRELGLRIKLM